MNQIPDSKLPGHRRCCEILGNGNFRVGQRMIQTLALRLQHARRKHPWPEHALGDHGALAAMLDELREVVDEMNSGNHTRRDEELFDVLAVGWRWAAGEQRLPEAMPEKRT